MRKSTLHAGSNPFSQRRRPQESRMPELQRQTVALDPERWSRAARQANSWRAFGLWTPAPRLH